MLHFCRRESRKETWMSTYERQENKSLKTLPLGKAQSIHAVINANCSSGFTLASLP